MRESGGEIAIVGTGSWGAALAVMLARHGPVTLLCRTEEEHATLTAAGENARFLPGVAFPPALDLQHDPRPVLARARLLLLFVPSSRMRENARRLAPNLSPAHVVISGAKGLETGSLLRMTEVLREELGPRGVTHIGALSGPNLAAEVAEGKPATSVVGGASRVARETAVSLLNRGVFRVYANEDVVGVEVAGALKNVVAVGAGAIDGLGMGESAKAAFVTRGLAEMARLGVACGANPLTFAGLAGLGDLLATVSSPASRNRTAGERFARGETLDQITAALAPQVAEGIGTTRIARELATRHGVEMPILEQTYQVLFEGKSVGDAFTDLLMREPRHELDAYAPRG